MTNMDFHIKKSRDNRKSRFKLAKVCWPGTFEALPCMQLYSTYILNLYLQNVIEEGFIFIKEGQFFAIIKSLCDECVSKFRFGFTFVNMLWQKWGWKFFPSSVISVLVIKWGHFFPVWQFFNTTIATIETLSVVTIYCKYKEFTAIKMKL